MTVEKSGPLASPPRTPDPSPAGEADLAAERLSDLVAYDPDMRLVLAELPRLRAALAAAEAKLALAERERDGIIDHLPPALVVRVRESGGLENRWATLAVSVARLTEVTKERDEHKTSVEFLREVLADVREKRRAAEGREAEIWEKAAKVCDSVSRQHWGRTADGAFECAVAIRNLAAPAGPGEAEAKP